jgi:hypothetical protein
MRSGADALKPDVRVAKALRKLGFVVPRSEHSILVVAHAAADETNINLLVLDQLLWGTLVTAALADMCTWPVARGWFSDLVTRPSRNLRGTSAVPGVAAVAAVAYHEHAYDLVRAHGEAVGQPAWSAYGGRADLCEFDGDA